MALGDTPARCEGEECTTLEGGTAEPVHCTPIVPSLPAKALDVRPRDTTGDRVRPGDVTATVLDDTPIARDAAASPRGGS
jgi:hypothetical protein